MKHSLNNHKLCNYDSHHLHFLNNSRRAHGWWPVKAELKVNKSFIEAKLKVTSDSVWIQLGFKLNKEDRLGLRLTHLHVVRPFLFAFWTNDNSIRFDNYRDSIAPLIKAFIVLSWPSSR